MPKRRRPGGGQAAPLLELIREAGSPEDELRKVAELVLGQSEQKFSTAFNSGSVAASIATAAEGRFFEAKVNYERDLGWTTSAPAAPRCPI